MSVTCAPASYRRLIAIRLVSPLPVGDPLVWASSLSGDELDRSHHRGRSRHVQIRRALCDRVPDRSDVARCGPQEANSHVIDILHRAAPDDLDVVAVFVDAEPHSHRTNGAHGESPSAFKKATRLADVDDPGKELAHQYGRFLGRLHHPRLMC